MKRIQQKRNMQKRIEILGIRRDETFEALRVANLLSFNKRREIEIPRAQKAWSRAIEAQLKLEAAAAAADLGSLDDLKHCAWYSDEVLELIDRGWSSDAARNKVYEV